MAAHAGYGPQLPVQVQLNPYLDMNTFPQVYQQLTQNMGFDFLRQPQTYHQAVNEYYTQYQKDYYDNGIIDGSFYFTENRGQNMHINAISAGVFSTTVYRDFLDDGQLNASPYQAMYQQAQYQQYYQGGGY